MSFPWNDSLYGEVIRKIEGVVLMLVVMLMLVMTVMLIVVIMVAIINGDVGGKIQPALQGESQLYCCLVVRHIGGDLVVLAQDVEEKDVDMTHCQMFQKVESVLPAKI